ncbi:hypothetical protein A2U01_0114090, partial [Trifolium medium]|nr:hypothetical protein [Trifolium medium]
MRDDGNGAWTARAGTRAG